MLSEKQLLVSVVAGTKLKDLQALHTFRSSIASEVFDEEAFMKSIYISKLAYPTGTISASIFGKAAKEIFGIDALNLMQCSDKEGSIDFASMGKLKTTTSDYYFQVKPNRNKTNQYIILKALNKLQQPGEEVEAPKTGPLKTEVEAPTTTSIQHQDGVELPAAPTT